MKKLTPLQKYINEQRKAVKIADKKEERDKIAFKKKMDKIVAQGIANREKQDRIDSENKRKRLANVGNFLIGNTPKKHTRKKKGKFKFFIVF